MTLNKEQALAKTKILTETETEIRLKRTIRELEGVISDLEDQVSVLEDQVSDLDEDVVYLYTQIAELGG